MAFRRSKDPKKRLGSFETPLELADFLSKLITESNAISRLHKSKISILDPAVGSGVLVENLLKRLDSADLGRVDEVKVWGIDIDSIALREARARLEELRRKVRFAISLNFVKSDFMDVVVNTSDSNGEIFDLIIANPPFIGHHALGKVKLEKWYQQISKDFNYYLHNNFKSSSWVPFVIKSHLLLKDGATLAFILPRSFLHSNYASEIRKMLLSSYLLVNVYIFSKYTIPHTGISPIILLAMGKSSGGVRGELKVEYLTSPVPQNNTDTEPYIVSTKDANVRPPLTEHWHAVPLVDHLSKLNNFVPVGKYAEISLGIVTGADKFFKISREVISEFGINSRYLVRCLPSGRSLKGLSYTLRDWFDDSEKTKKGVYLLRITERDVETLDGRVRKYIKWGEDNGFHNKYHTKKREPWFSLSLNIPRAFLTYVAGKIPKISLNEAQVTSTNSIHHVNFRKEFREDEIKALIVSFYSTPSLASAEALGRPMGGGALKLEPREAREILVLDVINNRDLIPELLASWEEIDSLLRKGDLDRAIDAVDSILVSGGVVSRELMGKLRSGLNVVRKARCGSSMPFQT